MKIFCILFLCFVSLILPAQSIDSLRLMNDLREFSSDKYEGRQSGTSGGRLAQFFLTNRFKEIGLKAWHENYKQGLRIISEKIDPKGPEIVSNYKSIPGANIIGYIPGIKKEAIVISAHYDHLGKIKNKIYNGADDNASGICALLSIAEYFMEHPPQHTLVFAAFDAEEIFMRGSLGFITNSPVSLDQILLNVNMDMMGTSSKNVLYVAGTYYSEALKPVMHKIIKDNRKLNLEFGYDLPNTPDDRTFRSDHAVFHLAGIPFLYFGVPEHSSYHQATDDYKNISHAFYYNASNLILRSIVALDLNFPDIKPKVPVKK